MNGRHEFRAFDDWDAAVAFRQRVDETKCYYGVEVTKTRLWRM